MWTSWSRTLSVCCLVLGRWQVVKTAVCHCWNRPSGFGGLEIKNNELKDTKRLQRNRKLKRNAGLGERFLWTLSLQATPFTLHAVIWSIVCINFLTSAALIEQGVIMENECNKVLNGLLPSNSNKKSNDPNTASDQRLKNRSYFPVAA